jgi:stage III sporulation protein AH
MNKQAITFLTLFSLILVLSIYYILLPPELADDSQVNISERSNSEIEVLQSELEAKRETLISENNDIIASASSDGDTISAALEMIAETKDVAAKERELIKIIQELGFEESFVEIDNNSVKVIVEKNDGDRSDANTIIKALLNHLGNEYQVEVKFIN